MELAQKVDALIQSVNGLVTVNEKLVGLLTEAFGVAGKRGDEAVKAGGGEDSYVR